MRIWIRLCSALLLGLAAASQAQVHVAQAPEMVTGPQAVGVPPPRAPDANRLTNETVLRMHQAGLSDHLILDTIAAQPGAYDTSPNDLIGLKQAGLSDEILAAMATKARRQITNAPVAPIAASPVNEVGIYYKDAAGQWQMMESEAVHTRTSGFVKNTLSRGIIKEDNNGLVTGPEAKLMLHRPAEFLIYTPEGVEGTEYDLLLLRLTGKNREFRVLTGGVFHSESGARRDEVPISPKRIAPHTWTFTLTRENAGGGEYGVLPPGTSSVARSGKIYTFAIVE